MLIPFFRPTLIKPSTRHLCANPMSSAPAPPHLPSSLSTLVSPFTLQELQNVSNTQIPSRLPPKTGDLVPVNSTWNHTLRGHWNVLVDAFRGRYPPIPSSDHTCRQLDDEIAAKASHRKGDEFPRLKVEAADPSWSALPVRRWPPAWGSACRWRRYKCVRVGSPIPRRLGGVSSRWRCPCAGPCGRQRAHRFPLDGRRTSDTGREMSCGPTTGDCLPARPSGGPNMHGCRVLASSAPQAGHVTAKRSSVPRQMSRPCVQELLGWYDALSVHRTHSQPRGSCTQQVLDVSAHMSVWFGELQTSSTVVADEDWFDCSESHIHTWYTAVCPRPNLSFAGEK